MKISILLMLTLASLTSNAQTFGFNKLSEDNPLVLKDTLPITNFSDEKYILSETQVRQMRFQSGERIYIGFNFAHGDKDSIASVTIVGDTLEAIKLMYKYFTQQQQQLELATDIINWLDLDLLYAQSGNIKFYNCVILYWNFLKNKNR